jgi:predicted RNase H-like nuclease
MRSVLGIDAAWSAHAPSGVALIAEDERGWRCVAVAPSYESFVGLSGRRPVNWSQKRAGASPDAPELIAACQELLNGNAPTVVAVDMPLGKVRITRRRVADDEISRKFGAEGCSTHTPSTERPGKIGEAISEGFLSNGFHLATTDAKRGESHTLIEVYPHPAIVALLGVHYRFAYKVSNSLKYWPGISRAKRYELLIANLQRIRRALSSEISIPDVQFSLPLTEESKIHLCTLKPYEDAMDALVCAWVGMKYLEEKASPYGDVTAAIWVPDRA